METDEVLETGYGPGAPQGDNLCNDYAQGLAVAFGELAGSRGERVDDGDVVTMTDGSSPSLFGNVVVLRRPIGDGEWPAVVEHVHGFYAGRPGGPFLVFSAWSTPDLSGEGFGRIGHPPLMFRPAGAVEQEPVDGLVIRPVEDGTTARDWEDALVHGYPDPSLQPFTPGCFLPAAALDAPRWRHWVAYLGDRPVGTSSAYVGDHHVDVEFISTMAEVRGRGIGRAVTAAATAVVDDRPAMLISSDDGRPVYDRLGYLPLLRFTMWAGHRR